MVNIAAGYSKRGHRALYDGQYSKAVECFFKAYLTQQNFDDITDLIYALNQNADYIRALEFCYALIGNENYESDGMLYFHCAEAFGGAGSIEGCAQMLVNSLEKEPRGKASEDARAFLKDLTEKYGIEPKKVFSEELSMGETNGITEAPFLSEESYKCIVDVSEFSSAGDNIKAIKRIDKEIANGNFSIAVLNAGIMLAALIGNSERKMYYAEKFKFIEDYTVAEIRTLAYDMNELNDDDIAYTVYKELYSKESGDKDIAFAFAVACRRMGEYEYASEIMNEVASSCGGIGPAAYALRKDKDCKQQYMLKYLPEDEKNFTEEILNGEIPTDNPAEFENMLEFVRYADLHIGLAFIEKIDTENFRHEIALRRLAVSPETGLLLRAKAAEKLSKSNEKVFLNTGCDIVLYTPAVGSVITRFFERNFEK